MVHDVAAARADARVRAGAARLSGARAAADRRLPRRRAADLRGADRHPARERESRCRAPAIWTRSSTPGTPGSWSSGSSGCIRRAPVPGWRMALQAAPVQPDDAARTGRLAAGGLYRPGVALVALSLRARAVRPERPGGSVRRAARPADDRRASGAVLPRHLQPLLRGSPRRHTYHVSGRGRAVALVPHAQFGVADLPADVRAGDPRRCSRARRRLRASGELLRARLLRAVPRDRLQLRQPADGRRGDLLLLQATARRPQAGRGRHARRASPTLPGPARIFDERSPAATATRTGILGLGEGAGAALGQGHALGPLLRAAAQAPRGRRRSIQDSVPVGEVTHKLKLGGNDEAGDLRLPRRLRPALRRRRPRRRRPAGRARRRSSRTTSGPSASACRRRPLPGLVIRGGEQRAAHSSAGHKFTLERHFDADGAYVLTSVQHTAPADGGLPLAATAEELVLREPASPASRRRCPFRPAADDAASRSSRGPRRPSSSARPARRSSPTSTAG